MAWKACALWANASKPLAWDSAMNASACDDMAALDLAFCAAATKADGLAASAAKALGLAAMAANASG